MALAIGLLKLKSLALAFALALPPEALAFSSVQLSTSISTAQLSRMSHCAPEATLNPICLLKFMPETVVMSSSRKCAGTWRLFQTRGPAAAKLLSPNMLCVRGTAHDLSVDERSRRLGPSETKCMSSAKYRGALPDSDTKHASLKSTRLFTGSQCN